MKPLYTFEYTTSYAVYDEKAVLDLALKLATENGDLELYLAAMEDARKCANDDGREHEPIHEAFEYLIEYEHVVAHASKANGFEFDWTSKGKKNAD